MINTRYIRLATACGAAGVIAAVGTPSAQAAPAQPQLRLIAASPSVTLDRFDDDPIFLDLGTYVVTGATPFELRVTRKSYHDPIVATQIVRRGPVSRPKSLPKGLVTDFGGLRRFIHVTLTDKAGKKVVDRDETFCPNSFQASRYHPDAPATSPYPTGCPDNPFTLGSVWGIQNGWAANTFGDVGNPVSLALGTYTATASITKTYRDLFGIPADQATTTIKVTVRKGGSGKPPHPAARAMSAPQPHAIRPTGPARVPAGPKPDLRPLPAWGIQVMPDGKRDYLQFSANVWNAGPSPLVVDGFRRSGQDLMDAYQYFYDARGKEVGHAPTGTMEWDARDGHEHWHFTDFARYSLLNANQQQAVRSQKEAFCLAATDAIDYTVPNANWKPFNTDLHTACGDHGSLSVREVLDVGSGDTYTQSLPGQSFDITNLPNGTYYVQVVANPEHRLYESNLSNNVSLRQVILGGKPGARTVTVPPYELIDAS